MQTAPNSPLISVIVPAYNAERWIVRCLDSILAQTLQDFEIIVVNDGSTDSTAECLNRFNENPRIHILTQANQGLSSARNAGLVIAKGWAVYFLDADDWLHPQCLEYCLAPLLRSPDVSFTLFDFKKVADDFSDPAQRYTSSSPEEINYLTNPAIDFLAPCYHWETPAVWRFCFRRDSLGDLTFTPGLSFVEDVDFLFRYFLDAPKGCYVPYQLHYYVQTQESLSRAPKTPASLQTTFWIIRRLTALYQDRPTHLKLFRQVLFKKWITVTQKVLRKESSPLMPLFQEELVQSFAERLFPLSIFSLRNQLRFFPLWCAGLKRRIANTGH